MKKITLIIILILVSITVYAREVPANNQGIANAVPGDYIIRANGEKVILTQVDIDYARKQLGLTATPSQTHTAPSKKSQVDPLPIIIVIASIAHVCLTGAVYKMKGGPWAVFYFFLAPLVLFLLLMAFGGNAGATGQFRNNRKDVHHHFH